MTAPGTPTPAQPDLITASPEATDARPANVYDPKLDRVDWQTSVPFLGVHIAAVATPFITGFSWKYVALAVGFYYLRMFAVTAGYHRYFSHRSYKTGRVFQFLMAFLAETSAQKGVLWWAAHHRHHHKYSDQPEDVHSPLQRGLWWAHLGWIMAPRYNETDLSKIKDFAKYPELVWLDKYFLVPVVAMPVFLAATLGYNEMLWGFMVSTVMLWHGTFTINSLSHVFGRRRYQTTDDSRNSMLLALITMGEGWHNNHHYYQSSTRQGFYWWEIDMSWYVLKALSWVGIVWDLREPSQKVREAWRTDKGAQAVSPEAKESAAAA